jgi:methylated-DNA-[protein]-cysteine S-methyltransferase
MNPQITLESNKTPIGKVLVTAGEFGLLQVDLPGANGTYQKPALNNDQSSKVYAIAFQALSEILEYLSGKRSTFSIPIDWSRLSPFQKCVLEETIKIPFGQLRNYGEIAASLGNPRASRATGMALGHNPMPIIIPCHRVVAAHGQLTGYSAADGIRTKQWLLELEGHTIVDKKLV